MSRLEGEELCRQLCEMQERLSTTEAQLQASQEAVVSKPDMAGAPWPGWNSHNVHVTGLSLCISQHAAATSCLTGIAAENSSLQGPTISLKLEPLQ